MSSLEDRLIVLAGGTSAPGSAVARAALAQGARVVVVGHDPGKLRIIADELPEVSIETCDLTDESAVRALAERVGGAHGRVDGILHLVGGWRGGGGLAGQSEEDYRVLETSFTALRHVSRAFDDDLRASDAGRLAIVSSTVVARPLAGGANYAAVKAASEAWTRAVAQGWAKAARDAGEPLRTAAVIFRAKALSGLEPVLGNAYLRLWDKDAADVNDTVIPLETAA